jgi:hypothetical protein
VEFQPEGVDFGFKFGGNHGGKDDL